MATRIYPDQTVNYFDGVYEATRLSQYCGFGKYRCYDRIGEELFPVVYHGKVYLDFADVIYLMESVKQ